MTGRLIACMGQDGEFASDTASRQAACKWLGDLLDEGKRWSEARSEIAQYYTAAGMEEGTAHAKSKRAKELIKPWLQGLRNSDGGGGAFTKQGSAEAQQEEEPAFAIA